MGLGNLQWGSLAEQPRPVADKLYMRLLLAIISINLDGREQGRDNGQRGTIVGLMSIDNMIVHRQRQHLHIIAQPDHLLRANSQGGAARPVPPSESGTLIMRGSNRVVWRSSSKNVVCM